ncbi:MAG: Calx-beta domain-containing protein [Rubrivivax sp.]
MSSSFPMSASFTCLTPLTGPSSPDSTQGLSRSRLFADLSDPDIRALLRDCPLPAEPIGDGVALWDTLAVLLAEGEVDTVHVLAHGHDGVPWVQGRPLPLPAGPGPAAAGAARIALWSCDIGHQGDWVRAVERWSGASVLSADGPLGRVDGQQRWVVCSRDGTQRLHAQALLGTAATRAFEGQLGWITVSFGSGFAGWNSGTNAATTVSSFGDLGWSNAQFAQNAAGNIFTAQGNDIIGTVLITDDAGVEHSFNGFVKWRTPSGNSPSTVVFQPDAGTHLTMASDAFGWWGLPTYPIDDTMYVGLTFNGRTLSFAEGDDVSGNAATSGLLDVLNNYLAAQPQLSIGDITVAEGAGTATFTVSLSTSSSDTITVHYDTSNGSATAGSDYTAVSGGTLSFAPGQTSKTVTVSIADDVDSESSETFSLVLRDPSMAAISDGTGVATITDNDATAGYTLGAVSRHTTEAGQTATFTVQLASPPSANVTVTVASNDSSEGSSGPSTLTFTPANWNQAQTVTVTGVDDDLDDGNIAYGVGLSASSSDGGYNGLSSTVALTNDDNDVAGLVTGAVSRHTTEAGQTATFTVRLASQPTADVTVTVASDDTTEGTAGPAALTFTAANWNQAQTVTVSGADDAAIDGAIAYGIGLGASSADGSYHGLSSTVAVTNDDDDSASFVLGAVSRHTTEAGQTATFTVRLAAQPTATVTVAVASDDVTEGTAGSATLSFTAANWNQTQTVTVTGADDSVIDGAVGYGVDLDASSADGHYDGLSSTVAVTNDDDDSASFVLGAVSRHTTEGGQNATFTVRLASQPTSDVSVGVSSDDSGEGSAGPATLTFTPANWNQTQTVTVTGADDAAIDGDIGYGVDLEGSSGDAHYDGVSATAAVTNDDDDSAGLVLGSVSRHTTEGGQTATFTVRLSAQPTSNVSVAVGSDDTGEGTVGPSALTFTPANWNQAQTVTVTGADDPLLDGDIGYGVDLETSSADGDFDALSGSVSLTNDDDDGAGLVLGSVSRHTTEAGQTATFTVRLAAQPTADVTVDVASDDTGEGTAGPATLTFTSVNWNQAQTVTVTGADDTVVDGHIGYHVTLESGSADAAFDALDGSVAVVNDDNDSGAMVIGRVSGATSESGRSASFTVRLSHEPASPVTVSTRVLDAGEGRVGPATLTFTAANWNQPQTVTVTGVDDPVVDGPITHGVRLETSAAEPGFDHVVAVVPVTNLDNDEARLVVSAPTRHTSETGTTATFTVQLSSKPNGVVDVQLGTGDPYEGRLSTDTLSFGASDWNRPQTVTVTGVDDDLVDGAVAWTVSALAASSDENYDGRNARITVINDDDEVAGLVVDRGSAPLQVAEREGSARFTVRLAGPPQQPVTVHVSDDDGTEGSAGPRDLVFDAGNWNRPQTVTVVGVDDDIDDGDVLHSVRLSATSDARGWSGLSAAVPVLTLDDDSAGLVIGGDDLATGEDGHGDAVTLRLASRPTAPVTVTLVSSQPGEAVPATRSLTIAPEEWNHPLELRVDGVDDDRIDGDAPFTLRVQTQSADPGYDGRSASVGGRNADDDHLSDSSEPAIVVPRDGSVPGDSARLLDPQGRVLASGTLPDDPSQLIDLQPDALPDGTYVFSVEVRAPDGALRSSTPITLVVATDRDGVSYAVESAAHGGDANHDGVPDGQQHNVTQLPMSSPEAFARGVAADPAGFGVVLAGCVDDASGCGPVLLDANAQLADVSVVAPPAGADPGVCGPELRVQLLARDGGAPVDADPAAPGLQGRLVIDLPAGVDADTVWLWSGGTGAWVPVAAASAPSSRAGEGARLVDSDGDGRADRVLLTLTDGGFLDADGHGNGAFGARLMLGQAGAQPVWSVRLPGGDRLLTSDAAEARATAAGPGAVFEGAWFDSLPGARSVPVRAQVQPYTGDHGYGAQGQAMPYDCYQPDAAAAGFRAAPAGSGAGEPIHLYLDAEGLTQYLGAAQAAQLGLAGEGYRDLGVAFETTTSRAFAFDPEGFLVAHAGAEPVQAFVQQLAARYGSVSDPAFVDAVEQQALAWVDLIGIPSGSAAGAADLNAAFGTHFGA